MLARTSLGPLLALALVLAADMPATAVVARDPNDFGARLDVRSVSVWPIHDGEGTRFTVRFWNPVPLRLLRHHPIEIELPDYYRAALFLNRDRRLRLTWGDAGSACCDSWPASRVGPDTYTGKSSYNIFQAQPPPELMRGWSSRRLRCSTRICYLTAGRVLDRTRWVRIPARLSGSAS